MGIPTTGPVSLEEIISEFGGEPPHSLSEYYRNNVNVTNADANEAIPTSGTISLRSFYGAKGRVKISLVISEDTANFNLFEACGSAYVPGLSDITLTINSGVYVFSASNVYPALEVGSFQPTDTITVINNGTIIGAGGTGGRGSDERYGGSIPNIGAVPGMQGGTALYVTCAISLTNNGTIAGGGGGGGGGGGSYYGRDKGDDDSIAGGGGGGGAGFIPGGYGIGGVATGQENNYNGVRGSTGTLTTGGAGGPTGGGGYGSPTGYGGAGGALGLAGVKGVNGQRGSSGAAGGAAGYYLQGSQYITWLATGTLTGRVS